MLKTLTRLYYARLSRKNYREFERGYAIFAAHNLRNNTGTLRAEPYLCDNPYEDGARTACNDYKLLITTGGDALQDALKREQVLLARLSDVEKQVEELQRANRQLQALQLLGSIGVCIGGAIGSSDQNPKG